jgi:hypothetical protein
MKVEMDFLEKKKTTNLVMFVVVNPIFLRCREE